MPMIPIRQWLQAHPAPAPQARPKGAEVSYSQIRAYLECPWLFKLVYLDRKRPPLHPRSSLGLSIHRALEAFHRDKASELERLLELYEENWVHAGFSSAQEQLEWHGKGVRVLESYWKQELESRSEIVAVEKEFLFPLGPHQVRGTIDRIDRRPNGEYEVIDYKTHFDVETEEEVAGNLQLGMYGLGLRESLGLEPSWLTLYYVAAGRRVSVPYDPSREEEIKELVSRVADLIASARGFKPDTSYCPSCDFRKLCPHSIAKGALS